MLAAVHYRRKCLCVCACTCLCECVLLCTCQFGFGLGTNGKLELGQLSTDVQLLRTWGSSTPVQNPHTHTCSGEHTDSMCGETSNIPKSAG